MSFDELGIKRLSEEEGPVALRLANLYRLPREIERKRENCVSSDFSTLEADFHVNLVFLHMYSTYQIPINV